MSSKNDHPKHVGLAIVGSGFSGLGAAIRLKSAGFENFTIFERAEELGGVWRDNTYPGCACDVESHLYSFSFAPNPSWSRSFSPQREIQSYLQGCAERYGLHPHLRLGHAVEEAAWDDEAQHWRIETSRGFFTADVLIAAPGGLSEPKIPNLPGLESFAGKTFHSARWDHGHDLRGKRIAVIGTGASAIQFVPAIQPLAAKLTVFQRTPPWIVPRRDRAISARARRTFERFPVAQRAVRGLLYYFRDLLALGFMNPRVMKLQEKWARAHLAKAVRDPVLRKKLTPDYTIGCKRILLSDDYLPALTRENVEVVTDGIREVRPDGIVTTSGEVHQADTIIFGTGFRVTDMPLAHHVRGRDGRTLHETWGGSPRAHLGTTVHGFPNLFFLQGPNTGLGHTSVILMIESQIEHLLGALRHLRQTGAATLEPSAEAQEKFVAEIDRKLAGSVWNTGGCASWYLDETGRNSTLWPGFTWDFKRRVERFDPAEYLTLERKRAPRPIEAAAARPAGVRLVEERHV